mmetsp:Transcript_109230/g.314590  ORF Transcript_109230/g.314590 Transcript_109230/m.314590 type:complete len:256 (+) Transcript_109230:865-1632(+)
MRRIDLGSGAHQRGDHLRAPVHGSANQRSVPFQVRGFHVRPSLHERLHHVHLPGNGSADQWRVAVAVGLVGASAGCQQQAQHLHVLVQDGDDERAVSVDVHGLDAGAVEQELPHGADAAGSDGEAKGGAATGSAVRLGAAEEQAPAVGPPLSGAAQQPVELRLLLRAGEGSGLQGSDATGREPRRRERRRRGGGLCPEVPRPQLVHEAGLPKDLVRQSRDAALPEVAAEARAHRATSPGQGRGAGAGDAARQLLL